MYKSFFVLKIKNYPIGCPQIWSFLQIIVYDSPTVRSAVAKKQIAELQKKLKAKAAKENLILQNQSAVRVAMETS